MACKVEDFEPEQIASTQDEEPLISQLLLKNSLGSEWIPTQWTTAGFEPSHFLAAMLNLIRNPNITSSHLFRADIFYDSDTDTSTFLHGDSSSTPESTYTQHLQAKYQPLPSTIPGFKWQRTIVRELIPRNRQTDAPLPQTCHIFLRECAGSTTTLVILLPHLSSPEETPFYHPSVRGLCFAHVHVLSPNPANGLALHLLPFPSAPLSSLAPKLPRITLRLLSTAHKIATGVRDNYVKRVNHDVLVPQRQFQETYARLKETYAKALIEDWREQTDPGKHVFEDLAIAAFLIELWREDGIGDKGFVDIGCGNGLLVHLLISEGYHGWGFDVRKRKSWDMYPAQVQEKLQVRTLVPKVLGAEEDEEYHDGMFERGTFIISNHADELTAWTPLLAAMNGSAFVAIPCCSHDLGGNRFRAPKDLKMKREAKKITNGLPVTIDEKNDLRIKQAAETGSLRRPDAAGAEVEDKKAASKEVKKTQPSAYAALCKYVALLATAVDFIPETEMLRIPSTRNACIVGRKMTDNRQPSANLDATEQSRREDLVCSLIEAEMSLPLSSIRVAWLVRAALIAGSTSRAH